MSLCSSSLCISKVGWSWGACKMQLVADLNGNRVDATVLTREAWRGLKEHSGYKDLKFPQCGTRAIPKTSKLHTQFFAHYRGAACTVAHKSETAQHLAMKQAVAEQINAVPGWEARVEYPAADRDWIADVMAFSRDGRMIAFEVQLSEQSKDDYARRTQRYFDAGIGPVWLVPAELYFLQLEIPHIVTGFRKSSPLPQEPRELMRQIELQPLTNRQATVGSMIDLFLSPRFAWKSGSPEDQRLKHEQELVAAKEAAAAAELRWKEKQQADALRREEQKRKKAFREEEQKLAKARKQEEAERRRQRFEAVKAPFVELAEPATFLGVARPVESYSNIHIWASLVRCRATGHRVLVWQTQPTGYLTDPSHVELVRREKYAGVSKRIAQWLRETGTINEGEIPRLMGRPHSSGFACSVCEAVIDQRLIAALPIQKWSLIAKPAPPAPKAPTREKPALAMTPRTPADRIKRITVPNVPDRKGPEVVDSSGTPLWHQDARTPGELKARQAAKAEFEAQRLKVLSNPQYVSHGNNFRFTCKACNQEFDSYYGEALHRDARCSTSDR